MTIICGLSLDGDETAVLATACLLAQKMDTGAAGRVVAVHVIADTSAAALQANQSRLEQLKSQVSAQFGASSTSNVQLRVVAGPAADTLGALADTEGARMLVVGANSKGGGSLGSVASQLLTVSSVPVLLLRDAAAWISAMTTQRRLRTLIGIDDSSVCEVAMSWVQTLATQVPIHAVLGAIYYSDDAAARYGVAATKMIEDNPVIEQLLGRDLLRRWNASAGEAEHVAAHSKRGLGRIGDHLLEIAELEQVDVVVVGTSQKIGLGKLGSVSSAVVAGARQSVLCIPPSTLVAMRMAPPMRSVLVATDCSAFANRAIPYAYSLCAGQLSAEVHIVHVRDKDDSSTNDQLSPGLHALIPVETTAVTTVHMLQADETAVALAQCAARIGADVICMASHGRSGIARAVMGSVADQVLRHTTRPVMIVRPSS